MPNRPRTFAPQRLVRVAGKLAAGGKRPGPRQRGYDAAWQKLALLVRMEEPFCRECGPPTLSRHVDHIVPRRRGGTNARGNLQALCASCHARKTRRGE
jgi:5-methylcytosine-specific restriction enzyme A